MYEWCLTKKCIYPGLDRGRRSYESHTTEQKIEGGGALLDLFVGPYLLDPSHFDVHLNLEEGAQFISDVSTRPWLKGALLHAHFCDYAILAGRMKETMEQQTQGKNSEYFLELCGKGWSFESIKEVVQKYVPFEVTWRDCSASSCMVVRLLQCWLGGSTRRKGRFQEFAPKALAFKTDLGVLLHPWRARIPRAQTLSGAFLHQGQRWKMPNHFCRTIGMTGTSSSAQQQITNVSRYKASEKIYLKMR